MGTRSVTSTSQPNPSDFHLLLWTLHGKPMLPFAALHDRLMLCKPDTKSSRRTAGLSSKWSSSPKYKVSGQGSLYCIVSKKSYRPGFLRANLCFTIVTHIVWRVSSVMVELRGTGQQARQNTQRIQLQTQRASKSLERKETLGTTQNSDGAKANGVVSLMAAVDLSSETRVLLVGQSCQAGITGQERFGIEKGFEKGKGKLAGTGA